MKVNNKKGFTLVEVIVVAVIVAVLAAVAIPLYRGYLLSSRTNVCTNVAGSMATFCIASMDNGTTIPAGPVKSGAKVLGAKGTSFTVPQEVTATVGADNFTCTVVHNDDAAATATRP